MLSVCLTGGPCAGKSTVLQYLKTELETRGYTVLAMPEAATSLIRCGAVPNGNVPRSVFQNAVFLRYKNDYQICDTLCRALDNKKTVVLYDRGPADQSAYIGLTAFETMIGEAGMTRAEIFARYDAVFFLVTAAKGKAYAYERCTKTNGGDTVRFETPEEAAVLDTATLWGWIGHPHLRVFEPTDDFTEKCRAVLSETLSLLEEHPKEIERKYVVTLPENGFPPDIVHSDGDEITQTLLVRRDPEIQRRVRRRGSERYGYTCYYTEKSRVTDGARFEDERIISEEEYRSLLREADPAHETTYKTRVCFVYAGRFFELDIYPFDARHAILEIELNALDEIVSLPDFFPSIRDVTGDARYKNTTLAQTRRFPDDEA